MSINRYNMDMCNGPLLGKMIRYAIPLAITYILQLTFHAADLIIIGNFGSYKSMASIGTTADLINLMVNMLVGISVGANILAGTDTKMILLCAEKMMNNAVSWKNPYGGGDAAVKILDFVGGK